ncbi:MAG: hypothetical protein KJ718_06090 [Nanoarchaeota archaeon]|nr:hypothetical protein [Nanoarchaeota archaeon]MBU1052092.1 hypothetical protein [Nanoarchaeota archaeon]MBU1988476.1 hypothetical protein [Nanoarchaeota archaeon]
MAKKINNPFVYVLLIVSLVFVVLSLVFVFNSSKLVGVREFDVYFEVDVGSIGFDVNNTFLTFGQVNPSGGGKREVTINNNYNFPVKVEVLVSENMLRLVDVESGFIVEPGKNVSVPVKLNVPDNFALGNYTGKIRFEMYEFD